MKNFIETIEKFLFENIQNILLYICYCYVLILCDKLLEQIFLFLMFSVTLLVKFNVYNIQNKLFNLVKINRRYKVENFQNKKESLNLHNNGNEKKIIKIILVFLCITFYINFYDNFVLNSFKTNDELQTKFEYLDNKKIKIKITDNLKVDENGVSTYWHKGFKKYSVRYMFPGTFGTKKSKKEVLEYKKKIKYGDIYEVEIKDVKAIENKINNPSSFNYQNYMKSKRISVELNVSDPNKVGHKNNFILLLKNIRNKFITSIEKVNPEISPYINSLIFGEKSFEEDYNNYLTEIGIIQLFTISGLHVNLIIGFLENILFRIGVTKERVKKVNLFILPIYLIIAGGGVSVCRAVEMKLLLDYYEDKSNKNSKFLILISVLLFNLFLNPFNLFNIGFILTYLITGILLINGYILKIKEGEDTGANNKFRKINKEIKVFIQTFKTTLIIDAFLLPILINLNYSFNIASLFFLYFYEKIVKGMLILSFLFISLLIFKFVNLMNLIGIVYEKVIYILNYLLTINYEFTLSVKHINIFVFFLFYYFLKKIVIKYYLHNSIDYKHTAYLFYIFIIVFLPINIVGEISIIDVGQGDSILIQYPFCGETILIDTGPSSSEDELIEYLKYENIRKIDYLIITHPHEDHMGNIRSVLENIDVKNVILNAQDYQKNIEIISNEVKKFPKLNIIPVSGLIDLNKNFKIYAPEEYSDNPNNNSLITYAKLGRKKWLFMGDTETEEEKKFIDSYGEYIDINFLKAGHHGSKTSTSEELLNITSPQEVFISSGKDNVYNHPSVETIEKLDKLNIKYSDTQDKGLIKKYFI